MKRFFSIRVVDEWIEMSGGMFNADIIQKLKLYDRAWSRGWVQYCDFTHTHTHMYLYIRLC